MIAVKAASVPALPRLIWLGPACSPRRAAIAPVYLAGSSTSPPSEACRGMSVFGPLIWDSGSLRHTSGRHLHVPWLCRVPDV